MIRTLIVDDEPLARKRLRDLLARSRDCEIVGECANGVDALEAIRAHRPELAFLDVQMPDMDGFSVVASIPVPDMPVVIFVSAYDEYALDAFDAHALDYLLKPFADERFDKALVRARDAIDRGRAHAMTAKLLAFRDASAMGFTTKLPVKSPNRIYFVSVDDIEWIQGAGVYSELHTESGAHLVRLPLSELERKLDPEKFLRIHRSTIVRFDAIAELRPESHGDYSVTLSSGKHLRMSRSYRARCQARLGW